MRKSSRRSFLRSEAGRELEGDRSERVSRRKKRGAKGVGPNSGGKGRQEVAPIVSIVLQRGGKKKTNPGRSPKEVNSKSRTGPERIALSGRWGGQQLMPLAVPDTSLPSHPSGDF